MTEGGVLCCPTPLLSDDDSYVYEATSESLAMATGTSTVTYASTPSGPLGQKSGSTLLLYLRDLHSDLVGTISSNATLTAQAYYSPWGEATWTSTAPALGYQSQLTDTSTGLVDMNARNYVPSLGRFASRDAVFGGFRHPLSLNQWIYAGDDPVSNWDPTGTVTRPDTGGCGSLNSKACKQAERDYERHNDTDYGQNTYTSDGSGRTVEFEERITPEIQAYVAGMSASTDVGGPGCGFAGWRCYDDLGMDAAGFALGMSPGSLLALATGGNPALNSFYRPRRCSANGAEGNCWDSSPVAALPHLLGYGAFTVGDNYYCAGSVQQSCSSTRRSTRCSSTTRDSTSSFASTTRWLRVATAGSTMSGKPAKTGSTCSG